MNRASRWLRLLGVGLLVALVWNIDFEAFLVILKQAVFPIVLFALALTFPW